MPQLTEQQKELSKLAEDIARELGNDWRGSYQESGWNGVALVARNDGAALHLYPYKGRVKISGEYPPDYSIYAQVKEITVALSRGPKAIAQNIKSRLLVSYLESYAKAVETVKKAEEFEAARLQAVDALAAIVKTPAKNGVIYLSTPWLASDKQTEKWHPSNIYGTVTLSSKYYGDLKLDFVPVSLLTTLLQVIADYL